MKKYCENTFKNISTNCTQFRKRSKFLLRYTRVKDTYWGSRRQQDSTVKDLEKALDMKLSRGRT
jgi:hypothetical protein